MDNEREEVGQQTDVVQPEQEQNAGDMGTDRAPEPASAPQQAEETASSEPEQAEPGEGAAPSAQERTKDQGPSSIEDLKAGMQLKGKVRNVVDFGAFVDVGVGRDGLAHVSSLKRAGIDKDIKVGDVIDVVVRRVDLENNRISLTVPRAEREVKASLRELEVGSVVTGRVMRLVDFGAFVDVGAATDGLLHVSQLPWGHVNHPSEALKVGDELKVRILDVDTERKRISLTMKDLGEEDAPELQMQPRAQGRAQAQQQRPSQELRQAPRQAPAPEPQQSEPGQPTAMELAFQQALADRRRKRRARG